jgi:hypothetical protein
LCSIDAAAGGGFVQEAHHLIPARDEV